MEYLLDVYKIKLNENKMITTLVIYLILAFIWGIYAAYRNYQMAKKLYGVWLNVTIGFLINFILFPYCLYIAIKNKKLWTKN
jgi:beta-lactamase regulating signal transducer with metallopeptidase domain